MTLVKRKYKRGIIKFLLATVYLFLFAAQINGRFYSIANFYVYGQSQAGTATESLMAAAKTISPEFKANHASTEIKASTLSSKVKGEKSRTPGKPLHQGKAVRLIAYKTTRQDSSHLSLDKRFQGRYPVQATLSDSLLTLLTYAEFKRKCTVCDQAVKSFDRTINSLRGPPAA